MTTEQVGAHFLLICKAWFEDPPCTVPDDDVVLARWARLPLARWRKIKAGVLCAYYLGEDGRWHQKRLEEVDADQAAYRESMGKRARTAAEKRWAKDRERRAGSNAQAMLEHPPSMDQAMLGDAPSPASASSDPIGSVAAAGAAPPLPSANGNGKHPRKRRPAEPELELPLPLTTRACQLWREIIDGTPPGDEIAGHLGRLVKKEGKTEAEVLQRWEKYLRMPDNNKYKNPAKFAQTYGTFDQPPAPRPGAFRDICPRDPVTGELVAPTFSGVDDDY